MKAVMSSLSARAGHAQGLDRWAIALSGVCVVHCVASSVLIALMATAGGVLAAPIVHEVGLVAAILLGIVALGRGAKRHRRILPASVGAGGLAMMAWALTLPHDAAGETLWTITGVTLLAMGHVLNQRAARLAPAMARP